MAPRKRRDVGRVKGSITPPPTSTHPVNTRGFAALADEIYLEIVSHIPSVPIPTSIHLKSHPEIRRSRHETFLSLTQTSRSLRRFFWRYLWQYIEVREGMKNGDKKDTLKEARNVTSYKKFATELVRQLEIVTVRNPQLAQYVNYLDIFIAEYSIKTVLAELARCLGLFPNLHTVQIDVDLNSRLPLGEIFEQTFKKYSYPQIRNVFIMRLSVSFVASCPWARHVGFTTPITRKSSMSKTCLGTILRYCPHLEVLEGIGDIIFTPNLNACSLVVNNLPNLCTIQFIIFPLAFARNLSRINTLKELKHLQTIVLRTLPPMPNFIRLPPREHREGAVRANNDWIKLAQIILISIQRRDNLVKRIVTLDYDGIEKHISLKPKPSLNLEELQGSFA